MTLYRTILADPPYSFKDKGSRIAPDWKERHRYDALSMDEIMNYLVDGQPINSICDPSGCHLYLWVPAALKEDGYKICRAWGFKPKLELVWIKLTKLGNPHFGMGHYYRHAHESVIFGVRGKLGPSVRNQRTVFAGKVREHSRKPDELYEIIEKVSPGPRLELFARHCRDGWDSVGDQLKEV